MEQDAQKVPGLMSSICRCSWERSQSETLALCLAVSVVNTEPSWSNFWMCYKADILVEPWAQLQAQLIKTDQISYLRKTV